MSLGGTNAVATDGSDESGGNQTLPPQLLLQQQLPLPTLRFSRRMKLLLASHHLDGANTPLDRDLDQFDDDGNGDGDGDDAFSISTIDHIDDGQMGSSININHINNPLVKSSSPSISHQTSSSSSSSSVWSKSDDELLKSLVLHLGRRWSSIAEIVGRSPEDVMLRYDFKIAPRRLGSWSKVRGRTTNPLAVTTRWQHHVLLSYRNAIPSTLHVCLFFCLFSLVSPLVCR